MLLGTSPSETADASDTCPTSHSREPCMSLLCRRLQERGSNPWSQGYEPCELPTALPCYKTVDVSDTCPTSHPLDPHMSLLWRWQTFTESNRNLQFWRLSWYHFTKGLGETMAIVMVDDKSSNFKTKCRRAFRTSEYIVAHCFTYCNSFFLFFSLKLFFCKHLDKDVRADGHCCENCEDESEPDNI